MFGNIGLTREDLALVREYIGAETRSFELENTQGGPSTADDFEQSPAEEWEDVGMPANEDFVHALKDLSHSRYVH